MLPVGGAAHHLVELQEHLRPVKPPGKAFCEEAPHLGVQGVPRVQGQGHGVEAVEGGAAPAFLRAVLYVVVDQDPVLEELHGGCGLEGRLQGGSVGQGAVNGEEAPEHLAASAGIVLEKFLINGIGVGQAGEELLLDGRPDGFGRGLHALHFRPCAVTPWAFSPSTS